MNELQTVQAVDLSTVNPATLQTLKDTVAQGATDSELSMFLTLAGTYKLDPFAKQIYFMKAGGKPTIITGRDGYLAIAQRDKNFDGLLSGTVHENDEFEIDTMDGKVIHKPNLKDSGKIVGAWAIAYHKDRKPAPVYVKMKEYMKQSQVWSQYPSSMIEKVAEARALKRQFGISGLVTEEEIGASAPEAPQMTQTFKSTGSTPAYGSVHTTEVVEETPDPVFKRGVEAVYVDAGQILQDLLEHQGGDPTKWEQMIAVKIDSLFHKSIYECTKKEMEQIRDGIQLAFDRLQETQQEPEVIENAPTLDETAGSAKDLSFEEAEALFNAEK